MKAVLSFVFFSLRSCRRFNNAISVIQKLPLQGLNNVNWVFSVSPFAQHCLHCLNVCSTLPACLEQHLLNIACSTLRACQTNVKEQTNRRSVVDLKTDGTDTSLKTFQHHSTGWPGKRF